MEDTRGLSCSHDTSRGAPCTSTTAIGVLVRLATACEAARGSGAVQEVSDLLDACHQTQHNSRVPCKVCASALHSVTAGPPTLTHT